MIPIPKYTRLFKMKRTDKYLSKISGSNEIEEMAVCVGCRETKVSLTKLDQDRNKGKVSSTAEAIS